MTNNSIFRCRICRSKNYFKLIDLGEMALTGVFLKNGGDVPKSFLSLNFCKDCSLVQLGNTHDKNDMFGDNYMYRSAVTETMKNHFNEIIEISKHWLGALDGKNVLEIASNDGTLINMLNELNAKTTAIDPSSKKHLSNYPSETDVYLDFFDKDFNKKFGVETKFNLILSLAVLYDVDDPISFAKTIFNNLEDNGIWITEQTSSLTLLDANAYDSICHEHLTYLSYKTLNKICENAGLRIIDVYKNDINGKSLVLVITKIGNSFKSNTENIQNYIEYENSYEPDKLENWKKFSNFVNDHKVSLKNTINQIKKLGSVFGYGASTKGNVLIQHLNLSQEDLPFILERDKNKYGLETPGSRIPIISESEGKRLSPSGLVVFPWHFKSEIIQRENEFISNGGKLIFPLPDIEVIQK